MKSLKSKYVNLLCGIALLHLAVLTGCEKIDSSLLGSWDLDETTYEIMANQDFMFTDVFGSPWQGTVVIDGVELDPADFHYGFNNEGGQMILTSKDVFITLFGGNRALIIDYNNSTYILEKEFTFDILSGIFKVEGTAQNFAESNAENKPINVSIDMKMPQIAVKKGERFSVEDGYWYIPYRSFRFKAGGKLQIEYLTGDIMESLNGKWSVNNNVITIQPEGRPTGTYEYQLKNNALWLLQDKATKEAYPHHISPFSNNISKVTYRAVYKRE